MLVSFWANSVYPAKSRIWEPAQDIKVFWFFSSEKNKEKKFFSEEKAEPALREPKDFCFCVGIEIRDLAGEGRLVLS